ncbi:TM2 domain-containing protein almondex [Agrilus planipennis]|uniref:TM2 domain-containing protein almondex n=1 Tax=Agrilus planipennis TaxID=224129 RepID=A0A1W4X925_AGRPL|nr:TM2 domain-containing protein almondex [Agrilus planipennis]
MRCTHFSIPKILSVIGVFIINNIRNSELTDNHMTFSTKTETQKNTSFTDVDRTAGKNLGQDAVLHCPSNIDCNKLSPDCIVCDFNYSCNYGEILNTTCYAKPVVTCKGNGYQMQKTYICRYCYQTEPWEHKCEMKANCDSADTPKFYYRTNCTVKDHVLCLGHRTFNKNVPCNWTGGYRWSTALLLSITLGGFGADRFYLGHWQEGIGKLFSFGGLGVWSIIDVILISLHYLGPADGSLYI